MLGGKERGKIAVFGHRGRHAGAGEHGGVEQRNVSKHSRDGHEEAEPTATDQSRRGGEIGGVPILPIVESGERK